MIDQARTVRPGEQLDTERLSTFLTENLPGAASPLVIEQFPSGCLLYTSDAADERSRVDLGGRRFIKKKRKREDD